LFLTEPRFDMCAAPPPEADWAYEVDDTDVTCGPGWWPLHRHGQPDVVRLAPNTRYWTWRNEYVLLGPGQGATVTARLTRDLARRAWVAWWSTPTSGWTCALVPPPSTPTVPARCVSRPRPRPTGCQAAVLAARAERRRRTGPTTAHDRWIARKDTAGKEEK